MNKVLLISIIFVALITACTPSATVEFTADNAVPLSMVEDLQFSDTSDLDIEACVQRFLDIAEPDTVTEGDVVPADFALLIDLDQVYLIYEEFELQPLCNKLNWGMFRTTGIVEIPAEAEIWSIDMDA